MGSRSKYNDREMVAVPARVFQADDGGTTTSVNILYAFPTNVKQTERTALGHQVVNSDNPPERVIIGASNPKPLRASIKKATYYASSYCDMAKVKELRAKGWRVSRPSIAPKIHDGTNTNSFVRTMKVRVRGIDYAWLQPKVTADEIGDAGRTILGVSQATDNDAKSLVYGAEFPKPPRAQLVKREGTGDNTTSNIISTFFDPDKTLSGGWTPSARATGSYRDGDFPVYGTSAPAA